jgi:hypothetical protein
MVRIDAKGKSLGGGGGFFTHVGWFLKSEIDTH